jgi:hypothetical protein
MNGGQRAKGPASDDEDAMHAQSNNQAEGAGDFELSEAEGETSPE